jgi:FtsP/CotA-like multicopper oxidase with cupredoxin domain
MKEGKRISVDVFNDTDVPELVHWHGQHITAEADGAEEQGSPLVPAHGHLRVSFTLKPSGTRWYHTHAMAMNDVTREAYSGQYGFLLVEAKSQPGTYDQEVFLAGRHWNPSILHRGAPNNDWTVDYKFCTLGDRALGFGEPIRVRQGQKILFRIHATRQLNLALPGHKFRLIALDGNPVPTHGSRRRTGGRSRRNESAGCLGPGFDAR